MESPYIVGGGIGGLTAAVALRRRGLEPVVTERAAALRPVGAGVLLGSNAMQALDRLGLADAVYERGSEKTRLRVLAPGGDRITAMDFRDLEIREFGHGFVAIHRGALQRVLLDALPGDSLRTDAECVDVTPAGSEVRLVFADGTASTAALVVGADGIDSTVRRQLFPAASVRQSGIACYRGVAGYPLDVARRRTGVEVWGRGVVAGYEALDDERVYWYLTATQPLGAQGDPEALSAALVDAVADYPTPIPGLVAATPAEDVIADDLGDVGPLESWSRGRVTLLGDAAHAPLPFVGQGAGQAIEDAVALARALDAAEDVEAAFAAYEAARREKAAFVVTTGRRLGRAAALEGRRACRLRNAAMGLVPESVSRRRRRALATLAV